MDRVKLFDVRKECRRCGMKYRGDDKEHFCQCGGFLYITGAYLQRRGGVNGKTEKPSKGAGAVPELC